MKFEYETNRLLLKALSSEHAKAVNTFLCNNRTRFEPFEPLKKADYYTEDYQAAILEAELKMFNKLLSARYYLFDKQQPDKIIGTVSLTNIRRQPESSARLGYRIDASYEGRGYMHEALSCIIMLAFNELPIQRLEAYISPENTRSLSLIKHIGFSCDGKIRNFCQINGIYKDHFIFTLLREEISKISPTYF